ncbi:MAG: tetratricopeptide repeat protein [Casimicrobium sp.]
MTAAGETRASTLKNEFAFADAIEEARLRDVLKAAPQQPNAMLALGKFLTAHARDREAASLFRLALRTDSAHVEARFSLAALLHSYEANRGEAVTLLREVLALDPDSVDAYRMLAWSLLTQEKRCDAVAVLREWVKRAPRDPTAQHLLAAYSQDSVPKRAPDEFVRKIFDNSADYFDALLRDTLSYCAPEVLMAALQPRMPAAFASVCDFGCGTGLCAPLLRPLTKQLVGVDLSERMIEKARSLSLYDTLVVTEGTTYLRANCDAHDLIFAADTLEYFGALDELLQAAFVSLLGAGFIAFTVERQPNDRVHGFELSDTGRYRHSDAYVIAQLSAAGFVDIELTIDTVRIEAGRAVAALVVVANKPPDARSIHRMR